MSSSGTNPSQLISDIKAGKYVRLFDFIKHVDTVVRNKLGLAGFNFNSEATYRISTNEGGEIFLQEDYFNMYRGYVTAEAKLTNSEIQALSRAYDTLTNINAIKTQFGSGHEWEKRAGNQLVSEVLSTEALADSLSKQLKTTFPGNEGIISRVPCRDVAGFRVCIYDLAQFRANLAPSRPASNNDAAAAPAGAPPSTGFFSPASSSSSSSSQLSSQSISLTGAAAAASLKDFKKATDSNVTNASSAQNKGISSDHMTAFLKAIIKIASNSSIFFHNYLDYMYGVKKNEEKAETKANNNLKLLMDSLSKDKSIKTEPVYIILNNSKNLKSDSNNALLNYLQDEDGNCVNVIKEIKNETETLKHGLQNQNLPQQLQTGTAQGITIEQIRHEKNNYLDNLHASLSLVKAYINDNEEVFEKSSIAEMFDDENKRQLRVIAISLKFYAEDKNKKYKDIIISENYNDIDHLIILHGISQYISYLVDTKGKIDSLTINILVENIVELSKLKSPDVKKAAVCLLRNMLKDARFETTSFLMNSFIDMLCGKIPQLSSEQLHLITVVVDAIISHADRDQPIDDTLIITAARQGNIIAVNALIQAQANINVTTIRGETPLFIAAQLGHCAVVEALINADAIVDQARETDGATPLFMAEIGGHLAVVEVLIKAGAKVDQAMTMDGAPAAAAPAGTSSSTGFFGPASSSSSNSSTNPDIIYGGLTLEEIVAGNRSFLKSLSTNLDHELVSLVFAAGGDPVINGIIIAQEAIRRAIADPKKEFLVNKVIGSTPNIGVQNEIKKMYHAAKKTITLADQQASTSKPSEQESPKPKY